MSPNKINQKITGSPCLVLVFKINKIWAFPLSYSLLHKVTITLTFAKFISKDNILCELDNYVKKLFTIMKRLMQLCNLGYFQFFPFKFMSYFLFDKLIFLKSEFCQLFLNKEILFSRGFDVCVFLSHECIFEFPSMEISLMVGRALKNQF